MTLSVKEAAEHLESLVKAFEQSIQRKKVYLQKGLNTAKVDENLESILNEVERITGDCSIENAKRIIKNYRNENSTLNVILYKEDE